MRWKKTLMRWQKMMGVKKPASFPVAVQAGAIGLVVCAVGAAMLIAARDPASHESAAKAELRRMPAAQSASRAQKAVDSAPTSVGEEPIAATITGCLERDAETYRLKDTSGTDAPKSRSWKSGFLKKGPSTIEVIDATNRLRLPNHVGRRVSVTGMLVDHEMQGRSLQRVAESCS